MPQITITWVTHIDNRTCKVCRYLNGRTWQFIADALPAVISHPHYGDVYDLRVDQSLAHGHGPWHCRCKITVEVDDPELNEELELIANKADHLNSTLEDAIISTQQFLSLLERIK